MSLKTQEPASKTQTKSAPALPQRRLHSHHFTAWLVLIVSFGLFCGLAYLVASNLIDYFSHSVQPQQGIVTALAGTEVSVRHTGQERFVLVESGQREKIGEGDIVRTAQNSTASIQLFDNSILELASNSELSLIMQQVRISNFVQKEKQIDFRVARGIIKVKIEPLTASDYSKGRIRATTPDNAEILFNDFATGNYPKGNYILDLEGNGTNRTWITSQPGNLRPIDVRAAGKTQSLYPGQYLIIERGASPQLPENGGRQLINNGAFIDGFDYWTEQHDQGGDGGSINGRALPDSEMVDDGTITRAHIIRYQSKGNFEETSLRQDLNVDVREYTALNFKLKGRLKYQTLPGGGEDGIEYPLFIKIVYTDRNGQSREFFHGFYFKAQDANTRTYDRFGNELLGSEQWIENKWVEYSVDLARLVQKPALINYVVVGSAGHDYESFFTEVSLIAKLRNF